MSEDTKDDRIRAELDRISERLRQEMGTAGLYGQLSAAQQALSWALNPEGAAVPLDVIVGGKVQPLMGTQADSGDCSAALRPSSFLGTCDPERS